MENTEQQFSMLQIVYWAVLSSYLVIMVVPFFIESTSRPDPSTELFWPFMLMAGVSLVAATVLRQKLPELRLKATPVHERNTQQVLQVLRLSTIISLVIREGAVVYGFVLTIFMQEPWPVLLLGSMAIAMSLYERPTKEWVNSFLSHEQLLR